MSDIEVFESVTNRINSCDFVIQYGFAHKMLVDSNVRRQDVPIPKGEGLGIVQRRVDYCVSVTKKFFCLLNQLLVFSQERRELLREIYLVPC